MDARLPQPTGTPPGRGEIFDRDALEHTKTFCVDLNHMESAQAAEVKEFLAKETGPGNCSAAFLGNSWMTARGPMR